MITVYCEDAFGRFNVRTSEKWQDAMADAEESSRMLADLWDDETKIERRFQTLEPDAEGVYISYQLEDPFYFVSVCIEGCED